MRTSGWGGRGVGVGGSAPGGKGVMVGIGVTVGVGGVTPGGTTKTGVGNGVAVGVGGGGASTMGKPGCTPVSSAPGTQLRAEVWYQVLSAFCAVRKNTVPAGAMATAGQAVPGPLYR